MSSNKFLELNCGEMSCWKTADYFKLAKNKYFHTGDSEDVEAWKEARKELKFDQSISQGRGGRRKGGWRGKGGRGGRSIRGGVLKDSQGFSNSAVRELASALQSSGQNDRPGRWSCYTCGSVNHMQAQCNAPSKSNKN